MTLFFLRFATAASLIGFAVPTGLKAQDPVVEVPGSLPAVLVPIPSQEVDGEGLVLNLASFLGLPGVSGPIYQVTTTLGTFNIEMLNGSAPATVANFIAYTNAGAYTNALVHRSVPGFIIQTGGFKATLPIQSIVKFAPVVNEFAVPNSRGTIAMAKLGGDPNSATNQWFVNLADNRSNLDFQNGGFTAFARVLGTGMAVADAIAAVPIYNAGAPNDNLPLQNMQTGQTLVELENLIAVNTVRAATRMPTNSEVPSVIDLSVRSLNPARASASIIGSELHVSNVKDVATIRITATDTNGNSVETDLSVAPPFLTTGVAVESGYDMGDRNFGGPTIRVVGLPPGLVFRPDTQRIEGLPRVPGLFKPRALVDAGDGSRRWEYFQINVDALPTWMRGNFDLVMERSEAVGNQLGGKLALRVSPNGIASGRLFLPGMSFPVRSWLKKTSDTEAKLVTEIPANRRLPEALQLDVTVSPDGQAIARVSNLSGEALASGWRNLWHPRTQPLDGERRGQINLLLDLASGSWAESNGDVPQGTSWAMLRTTPAGRGILRGRLSDGTPFGVAGFIGPDGQFALWRPLYRNGGSLMVAGDVNELGEATGSGTWTRPQLSNPAPRIYPAGFGQAEEGAVELEISGGRWVFPGNGETVLSLPYSASVPEVNASLAWEQGGVENSETPVNDMPLIIDTRHRASVPADWVNQAKVRAFLNPRSGLVTLRMFLEDENPMVSGRRIRRQAVHQMLMAPNLGGERLGGGYFLLGELADPDATPPTSGATSAILSGKVRLDAMGIPIIN